MQRRRGCALGGGGIQGQVGQRPQTSGFSQRIREAYKAMPSTFWHGSGQGRRGKQDCCILSDPVRPSPTHLFKASPLPQTAANPHLHLCFFSHSSCYFLTHHVIYLLLGWAKSPFSFFCKMLWKSQNRLFDQPNVSCLSLPSKMPASPKNGDFCLFSSLLGPQGLGQRLAHRGCSGNG